ncbi:MAG: hypothetical protein KatS3mg053_0563 [Candidatus Roseilinea sp.]|nr:MAG: hypothetical protein KatS3mg053_0563 [Candidatus Roseilinea sp.]
MSTGKASRAPLNLFIVAIGVILLLLLLALLIAFLIRSGRLGSPLPASVGLPDPVTVESQLVPTAAPPQPAQPPPVEPQAPAQPAPQPTAIPAPVSPPVFPSDVEPVPVEGGADDGSGAPVAAQSGGVMGAVEPYPVGPSSTGSSASTGASRGSSGGSRVACGVRVVHVVRPGENLFRIALRYNTTIASIARRNGIADARTIRVGQRLTIVTCR